MSYAQHLRELFPDLELRVEDLRLLEPHQISSLLERVSPSVLSSAIAAEPAVATYLAERHPPVAEQLDRLPPCSSSGHDAIQGFLWEIADWFAYVKAPHMYDRLPIHDWDFATITAEVDLTECAVIDAGAGTGRVTFEAAQYARVVYAVEPTTRLRTYIAEKAATRSLANIEILAGTLDAIPLPTSSADVLLTCRAIGWRLAAELAEVARVVRPGGTAIHLGGTPIPAADDALHRNLKAAGYTATTTGEGLEAMRKYVLRF